MQWGDDRRERQRSDDRRGQPRTRGRRSGGRWSSHHRQNGTMLNFFVEALKVLEIFIVWHSNYDDMIMIIITIINIWLLLLSGFDLQGVTFMTAHTVYNIYLNGSSICCKH